MISLQPYIKSFNISFTPSLEYDVVAYKIYALHEDYFTNGDFTPSESNLINEGPETSLLHQVDKGGTWGVKVVAVDTFGDDLPNYSDMATCVVASLDPLDQLPPEVPVFNTLTTEEETGFDTLGIVTSAYINLTWTLDPIPEDLSNFIISFKKTSDSNWNELYTSDYNYKVTSLLSGVSYDFKIRAVDQWNNSSIDSPLKTIVACLDTVAPNPPSAITALPSFGGISLKWTNPTDADLKQINIYRSDSNDSNTSIKIASVFGTSFNDIGLLTGHTYYYWLKSKDYSNNESLSFSTGVFSSPITIMSTDLDITARVDFVVKDTIFYFTHIDLPATASKTLNWTSGSIVRGGETFTLAAGNLESANDCYVIADTSNSTVILSLLPLSSSIANLATNQIVIAFTSSYALEGTNNYACYVRQSNSMAIEGATIRDATIANAKIKDLTADKIITGTLNASEYIGINDDQIKLGNIGPSTTGILIKDYTKTVDVFKVDSTGTATLKNVLIDGGITVGDSKIKLDGINSRITVASNSGSVNDMVLVGKLATGNYGISIKDASGNQVFKVDESGAVLQNLTAGTIDADKVTINNLVVGENVTMGPNAYISWSNVNDKPAVPNTTYIDANGIYTGSLTAINYTLGNGTTYGKLETYDYDNKSTGIRIQDGATPTLSIKGGTFTSNSISGSTIDGGTITGATLQSSSTVTSTGGIKIVGQTLYVYDSAGVVRVKMGLL